MIRFRFQSSIQNKVKYGYYICLALIVVVALLNYFHLIRIERKIAFSLVVSDLFDATLEMRRFEKNYILYRDKEDYAENLKFTEKAEEIIKKNREAIKKLSIKTDVYALEVDLRQYKFIMHKYSGIDKTLNPVEAYALEGMLRKAGKKVVAAAETISTVERKYIQSLIASSKRNFLLSIVFLIIAGCLIGQYLSLMVIRPLRQLEGNMQKIAEGRFDPVSINSSEEEIISLTNAFSRLIKEIELRQMNFIAQSEKLASLGTMISGIAHQLNNPLSNIFTSCQILQEEIEEQDINYKKELLQQIENQTDRAKNMVRSLLEFSRAKEFKGEPLPLRVLVEDTIRLIKGEIPTRVDVVVNIQEDIWITADKQRIQQVLLNIIKNSIDAIPDEGVICISAEEDITTKTTKIKIQDTGIGIEPEDMEKIFTPFFTTKADEKGSGLGLFVAREIIKEHGGIIEMDSTVGEGTTFIIKLPIKEI